MRRRLPAVTLPHIQRLNVTPTTEHGSPEWWDQLRETDSVYAIPDSRDAWLASIAIPEIRQRARRVAAVVGRVGATRVVSYGVGGAAMEKPLIDLLPGLQLTVTDNTPRAVKRLDRLFHEATVLLHDLRTDDPLDADLHILSRVETEFTDRRLEEILGRFGQPVLLIPGELLATREQIRAAEQQWQDTDGVFTGYRRTEPRFRELWRRTHHARRVNGWFLLEPRSHAPLPERVRHHVTRPGRAARTRHGSA